jgi:hypothetical protein
MAASTYNIHAVCALCTPPFGRVTCSGLRTIADWDVGVSHTKGELPLPDGCMTLLVEYLLAGGTVGSSRRGL